MRANGHSSLTDTVILTGLGHVPTYPSIGYETEERPWFSPPARRGSPVGLGAATLDGKVTLVGRYVLTQFDTRGTERFVDTYVAHIGRLIEADLEPVAARRAPGDGPALRAAGSRPSHRRGRRTGRTPGGTTARSARRPAP